MVKRRKVALPSALLPRPVALIITLPSSFLL